MAKKGGSETGSVNRSSFLFLSAQTQFFQTQFSTFWFLEVDQHSESQPPFPELLLRLSPFSIETKSWLSVWTSN